MTVERVASRLGKTVRVEYEEHPILDTLRYRRLGPVKVTQPDRQPARDELSLGTVTQAKHGVGMARIRIGNGLVTRIEYGDEGCRYGVRKAAQHDLFETLLTRDGSLSYMATTLRA